MIPVRLLDASCRWSRLACSLYPVIKSNSVIVSFLILTFIIRILLIYHLLWWQVVYKVPCLLLIYEPSVLFEQLLNILFRKKEGFVFCKVFLENYNIMESWMVISCVSIEMDVCSCFSLSSPMCTSLVTIIRLYEMFQSINWQWYKKTQATLVGRYQRYMNSCVL